MYRHLPNLLTIMRLVLAGIFFLVLNQYRYQIDKAHPVILWSSIALFILAALTDVLDGYLARRWNAESKFGRIMDPVCDKVLILGSFIYLAGPRFVIPELATENNFFCMISGVYPWMVVVMLLRELLVTGIRGEMESAGIQFGANLWGKLKMILQASLIPWVLLFILLDPIANQWVRIARDIFVYTTVIATVLSGLPYITQARRAMKNVEKPS